MSLKPTHINWTRQHQKQSHKEYAVNKKQAGSLFLFRLPYNHWCHTYFLLWVMVFTPSWLLNIVMMASHIISKEPHIAADASPAVLFCNVSNQYSFYQPWMVSLPYWDSNIGGDTHYHISLCVVFCTAIQFMLLLTNITDCIVTHSIIPIGNETHVNDIINWKNNVPLVEVNATPFPESRWQLFFLFLCDRELNNDHQVC